MSQPITSFAASYMWAYKIIKGTVRCA